MKYTLADNGMHLRFAPFTLTRPLGTLRVGIMTNEERILHADPSADISFISEKYLGGKFKLTDATEDALVINAQVMLDEALLTKIQQLKTGERLLKNECWIAHKGLETKTQLEYTDSVNVLENRWDIYANNAVVLAADFAWLTKNRISQPISATNQIIGDRTQIFLEEGAAMEACILNTTTGPIYLGKNSEIMEGSIVRGALALCEGAGLKLGTKIYGATTLGPHCKVGGEVNNVVFQAFSNKGHDGFLGNSVIGEWCNLGADTNSSNLKNNYSKVSAYNYETQQIEPTDVQFMGLMMGDHSKCGINTMFNTATVVGVSANIYGGDFPEKYIPSFSWGSAQEMVPFQLNKAIEVAKAMMERRKVAFTEGDLMIFNYLSTEG